LGACCLPVLAESGFDVIAVSSSASGLDRPGARWHCCDLLDPTGSRSLLERERPTHLLHLAWITQPGVFWSSPRNLEWLSAGTLLFDAFYALGGRRAVGLGSCAEYEIPRTRCVEEETPIVPATVYGKAKAAQHLALQAAAQGRGNYAWARLFSPYGPGEAQDRFIPSVIRGLLRGEPVPCTHGQQVRDFVFVSDVAAACVALLESDLSGAYNVASGEGISLREIADLITRHLGAAGLVRFGARQAPAFDPPRIVGDTAKIRRDIGWRPRVGLEDGLLRSIAAQKQAAHEVLPSGRGATR
jgi:nucleoside-diphosphate-sugar epimerase